MKYWPLLERVLNFEKRIVVRGLWCERGSRPRGLDRGGAGGSAARAAVGGAARARRGRLALARRQLHQGLPERQGQLAAAQGHR